MWCTVWRFTTFEKFLNKQNICTLCVRLSHQLLCYFAQTQQTWHRDIVCFQFSILQTWFSTFANPDTVADSLVLNLVSRCFLPEFSTASPRFSHVWQTWLFYSKIISSLYVADTSTAANNDSSLWNPFTYLVANAPQPTWTCRILLVPSPSKFLHSVSNQISEFRKPTSRN